MHPKHKATVLVLVNTINLTFFFPSANGLRELKKSGSWRAQSVFDVEWEEFLFAVVAEFERWGLGMGKWLSPCPGWRVLMPRS